MDSILIPWIPIDTSVFTVIKIDLYIYSFDREKYKYKRYRNKIHILYTGTYMGEGEGGERKVWGRERYGEREGGGRGRGVGLTWLVSVVVNLPALSFTCWPCHP